MDEDLLKWNTDCVYFLASPLTCKKGAECEYRHSEIARLNPRDCWYWLAGNCLNPTCGFRHPPLDAVAGKTSESAQGSSTVSVSKTGVPCYFYVNGYCSKGENCSFVHANDGGIGSGRSTKVSSGNVDPIPSDSKLVAKNDKESSSEKHVDLSKNSQQGSLDVIFEPKEEIRKPLHENNVQKSIYKPAPASELEEVATARSEPILPDEEEYLEDGDELEEQVVDHIEPEERWESSPGFDVLVDDESEKLGYEDDPEYFSAIDRERRELNSRFLGHEFEDPDEYDLKYHGADSSYDRLENGPIYHNERNHRRHSRDRNHRHHSRDIMLDSVDSRKRKLIGMELAFDDQNSVDLRDQLRRRRLVDDSSFTDLSRSHELSNRTSGFREETSRHDVSDRFRGRLAFNDNENGTLPYSSNRQESIRLQNRYNSRRNWREKRHGGRQNFSEVTRKTDSRDWGFDQESSAFDGPKSLAQIREERRKAKENGDYCDENHSGQSTRANFESPKRLSEIHKGKRGPNSATEEE